MNNEIKEINIPNDILAILGDLTNGAMNYYKNPKVIELKYKLLLDYINNLLKENKMLIEVLEINHKIIDKYVERIDKAIEYINKYLEREYFDDDILETNTIYNRDLFKVKKILNGDDKSE